MASGAMIRGAGLCVLAAGTHADLAQPSLSDWFSCSYSMNTRSLECAITCH